jgi:hypothetical protein
MNFADDFGGINWKILLSLTVAWVLVYLILMKVKIMIKNTKYFFLNKIILKNVLKHFLLCSFTIVVLRCGREQIVFGVIDMSKA